MDDPAVAGAVAQLIAAVATIVLLIGTAIAKRIQDDRDDRDDRPRRKRRHDDHHDDHDDDQADDDA